MKTHLKKSLKKVFKWPQNPFVPEKDGKTCFSTEKTDFDQQTTCRAPVCW